MHPQEYSSHLYKLTPYFLAKILAEVPFQLLYPGLFAAIVYPMAGLHPSFSHFIVFWWTLALTALGAVGYGIIVGASIANEQLLMLLVPLLIFPVFLFSGITAVSVPPALSWIQHLVYFRYSCNILVVNEFKGLDFGSASGDDIIREFDMQHLSIPVCFAGESHRVGLGCRPKYVVHVAAAAS